MDRKTRFDFDSKPRSMKIWYAIIGLLVVLAFIMNIVVVPRIVSGEGLPFAGTTDRTLTHVLKSRRGARILQVNQAEKAVLIVFSVLPWLAMAAVGGAMVTAIVRKPNKDATAGV